MIPGIGTSNTADLAKSISALSEMVQNAHNQAMEMTYKLVKSGIQMAVQESELGSLIDVTA